MPFKHLQVFYFFFSRSLLMAVAGYYLLWLMMPDHYVLGSWIRMYTYHWQHPITYILIPCFFYGLIAVFFIRKFQTQSVFKKILWTLLIVVLTIFASSPWGGMLWHYHDMQNGYFPQNWEYLIITKGFTMGFSLGWLIIATAIPYNILGIIIAYFLNQKAAQKYVFKIKNEESNITSV